MPEDTIASTVAFTVCSVSGDAGVPRVPSHRRREPLRCAGVGRGRASGDARAGQTQRGDDRPHAHAHPPRIADQDVRALSARCAAAGTWFVCGVAAGSGVCGSSRLHSRPPDVQKQVRDLAVDVQQRDGIDLALRVGLNSGEVIAGEVGSRAHSYTTIGDQGRPPKSCSGLNSGVMTSRPGPRVSSTASSWRSNPNPTEAAG